MREIKFRVWDKLANKIFYEVWIEKKEDGLWWRYENGAIWNNSDSERRNVMQYTGLKDRNGKEIYDGDIVMFDDGERKNLKFFVEWGEYGDDEYVDKLECWTVDGSPLSCLVYGTGVNYGRGWRTANGVEVVGNAYENPDLKTNETLCSNPLS
jgi:uncharacterized phage protein (TIGR01671 family)